MMRSHWRARNKSRTCVTNGLMLTPTVRPELRFFRRDRDYFQDIHVKIDRTAMRYKQRLVGPLHSPDSKKKEKRMQLHLSQRNRAVATQRLIGPLHSS